MLSRFDFSAHFYLASEAEQEIVAEARRDFVNAFPLQARIRARVQEHIAMGPARHLAQMIRWRLGKGYVQIPINLTPDLKLSEMT